MAATAQTVLLLGEESPNRQLLESGLCEKGYQVIKARSAREAEKALDIQPGIVVVDQRVRGTNGLAWIRSLREDGYTMPVVFCSASNCSVKTFNVLRNLLNVSLIVRKPLEPLRLISQMESLLETSAAGQVDGGAENVLQFSPNCISTEYAVDSSALFALTASPSQPAITEDSEEWQKQFRADCEMKSAIEDLGRAYLAEMPEILYELRAQVSASVDEEGHDSLDAACDTAHRIKGTAGSLGFPELSKLAGNIEDILKVYKGEGEGKGETKELARALMVVADIEMWLETWQDENQQWMDDFVARSIAKAAEKIEQPFDAAPDALTEGTPICHPVQAEPEALRAETLQTTETLEAEVPEVACPKTDRQRCIFLVDCCQERADAMAGLLKANGNFEVETFSAGLRVLNALEESQPDLLLLNAAAEGEGERCPTGTVGLTGIDICRMIRCHPKWALLPIIIVTADTSVDMRRTIYRSGATDFIAAPIVEEELVQRLRTA